MSKVIHDVSYVDRAIWIREMYLQGKTGTARDMLCDLLIAYMEVVAQGFGEPGIANAIVETARFIKI